MTSEPPWKPSNREQHALWYAQFLMRYVVGGGGLVYLLVANKFDPIPVLVLGALASSTDVFGFVRELVETAREEKAAVDSVVEREKKEIEP